MITINHTPEEVSLIGNPINYLVSSNNVLEDTAVAATGNFYKTLTAVVADDYFEITYQGNTHRFTAKVNPDASGNQIPIGTITEIAEAIALNYYINRDFNITLYIEELGMPVSGIVFTAKIADESYTFMLDVAHFPYFRNENSSNQCTHTGVSQKIKEGFLYVSNTYDNANNIIGTDQLPANSELKALFNIQEYFFEKLIPSFIYPHTATIANLKADMCFEYAVKFAEGTGIPTVFGQLKPDTTKRVIGGGIPQWQQKQLQDDSSTFWAHLAETKQFLNWYPGIKETTRTGSEKLYHIATNADATQASLYVRAFFSDGTNITYERVIITDYAKFNIYELFVDFASLQLDTVEATEEKTIETYAVWLSTNINFVDTYLSEVRTFAIADENYNDRLLIFRNSLATYETIRMTGNLDKSSNFTREVSNMIFPQEFIDTFRQKVSRITDTEERLTINTGYTDNIEITNWWMELLSSDDVYYWDGTRLISAVITNEEVLQYTDEEPVYNLALELMLSNASAGSVGLQGNYYSSLVNNGTNGIPVLDTQLTALTEFPTLTNISSADTLFSWARKFMKLFTSLKALAFKNKADWNGDIDNIPGTFPPSAHVHVATELSGGNNKVFGTDENGDGKEYALTDFGGAKKLVQMSDYIDGRGMTAFALKQIAGATLILTTSSTNSNLYRIHADGGVEYLASVATANGAMVIYCPTINEFHVISTLAGTIYRVSTTCTLLGSISIDAQTGVNRTAFCTIGDNEYYSSGANGVVLNKRNLTTGVITQFTIIAGITYIKCFSQDGVNYVSMTTFSYSGYLFDENLSLVNQLGFSSMGVSARSIGRLPNKLIITGADYNGEVCILDTTDIANEVVIGSFICAKEALGCGDYLVLTNRKYTNAAQRLFLKDANLTSLDSQLITTSTIAQNKILDYDSINDILVVVVMTASSLVINTFKIK